MFWAMIALIAVASMLTETFIKNKKIEIERLEKEIELEKIKLESFDKETEKMRLELEQSKQTLLETQKQINYTDC